MKRTRRGLVLALLLGSELAWAQSGGGLLTTLPDWNDENAAYRDPVRGLTVAAAQFEHLEAGGYSANELSRFGGVTGFTNTYIHDNTEGDDLWTAYQMWKRLEGIKPNSTWRDRMQNLKTFYVNNYVTTLGDVGTETGNNFDHLYGWGLCEWYKTEAGQEPDGGVAALAAIDGIVATLVQWNAVYQGGINPGDSILDNSNGGRRWARQLRFAVCAAEVSPKPANVAWRDKVIDIVMLAPDFNATHRMYFYSASVTDSKGFNSAAGERVINTFHMGLWMDAMWHAWRVLSAEGDPRATAVRQRLVDMGTYYRDYGRQPDGRVPLQTGINIDTGARLDTGSSGYGNTDVYTVSPVNGLVFAYKFTGNQSYLDAAWSLWLRFQESEGGNAGTIAHFADSQLSSANAFELLRHNKGELQYVYALFENGGDPIQVTNVVVPEPPRDLAAQ